MNTKMEESTRPRFGKTTVGLLLATVALTAGALGVGISDNPPGIILLYAAGATLVLAWAHRWRSPGRFGLLLLGSVVGFILTVVIHNFAEVGADTVSHTPVLAGVLSVISVAGFFLAVIVCPVGGIVGVVGGLITMWAQGSKAA